jgi:hypothetical protein
MECDSGKAEIVDVLIRGLLEKELDSVTPETMEKWTSFNELLPLTSLEDFIFGFILGSLYLRFHTVIEAAHQREPNDIENGRFLDVIERRTMEIRGKIKLAINR